MSVGGTSCSVSPVAQLKTSIISWWGVGGTHAINGLTGQLAVVFSFKEAPTAVVSNIVSEPVFFTKLLMHEWPGKAEGGNIKSSFEVLLLFYSSPSRG